MYSLFCLTLKQKKVMVKVKLNKFHNGIEPNTEIEVSKEQKHYFESVGLLAKEEKQLSKTKEEKNLIKTK